ncbi:hypothetical protein [uncultured Streptococcus sp.]|uniref:hypothetical protein n=1 Tax=uncultured Streptococcus sp. TaxID=83427 RepID=UPI0028EF5191|nr:hypothetical protein [uncultured Streptococcus sp.]
MKNFFEKPTLKKILLVLAVLFIIILAPITMPLMFLGGCFGIWRFTKRKPNIQKRNIAIAVTIVGILGIYAVGKLTPDVIKEQTEQSQVTKFTSNSSSTSSSSSQTSSSTASSSKKEKQEKERKEKELKEAQKQKQEEEKKAREEQARKEAETKKIVEEANQAVQQLENNQVAENISPAQAAVERVADPTTKSNLTDRIGRVQNAINQRAEDARQEAERQAAEQQQTRTVYVARNGTADVYWYSMENMPSNTRFDKVVSMTEADAIASGKRHTSKE